MSDSDFDLHCYRIPRTSQNLQYLQNGSFIKLCKAGEDNPLYSFFDPHFEMIVETDHDEHLVISFNNLTPDEMKMVNKTKFPTDVVFFDLITKITQTEKSTTDSSLVPIKTQSGIRVSKKSKYSCYICRKFMADLVASCGHNILCTKCAVICRDKTVEFRCLECYEIITHTITLRTGKFK